jgi:hypothetical protein
MSGRFVFTPIGAELFEMGLVSEAKPKAQMKKRIPAAFPMRTRIFR